MHQCFAAICALSLHQAGTYIPLQAMLLVDRLGRCKLQLLLFFCTGVSTICLMGSSFAEGDGDPNSCYGGGNIFPVYISVFLLFVGRGASNACFSATYVATPELYVPPPMSPRATPFLLRTLLSPLVLSLILFLPSYILLALRYTTNVRATALGVCSSVSRIAGIVCSYASGTVCIASFVAISGVLSMFGGLLSLSLPETKGKMIR